MKKKLLTYLIIFFVSYNFRVFAQDTISTEPVYKSQVTFEAGGAGLFISFNYEHLAFYKSKEKLLLRAGFEIVPYKNHLGNIKNLLSMFPLGIYYLIGDKNHLEIGLSNTFGYFYTNKEIFISPSIGYRYQKFHSSSFSFSLALSPIIILSKNSYITYREFVPWIKGAIGYNFNRKNLNMKPTSNLADTSNYGKRFFFEWGAHILIAKQSSISKNKNNGDGNRDGYSDVTFPIDTSNIPVNSLIVNNRLFPTLSFGLFSNHHEIKTEISFSKSKSIFSYSEDFGKHAYFNSKEYYFLLGYCFSGSMNRNIKLNPKNRFYIGGNLLFQHKDRQFYHGTFNNIGGNHRSNVLNSDFTSNHLSLIPEAGIKLGCQRKIHFKLGLRFNALSYVDGDFSWNYKTITTFPTTETHAEDSGRFSKFLFIEHRYFTIVDNIYLKMGFSF